MDELANSVYAGSSTVKQISLGLYHTCALRMKPEWVNAVVELVPNTTGCQDAGNCIHATEGVLGNGTLDCNLLAAACTKDRSGACDGNGTGCVKAVVERARRKSGLVCVGWGLYGQLGDNTAMDIGGETADMACLEGIHVERNRSVTQVSAGDRFTCALMSDGFVKCWGHNYHGQLGQGRMMTHYYQPPRYHVFFGNISRAGYSQGLYKGRADTSTRADGTLISWYRDGGLKAKQISAGDSHTCAILEDDTARCWGKNRYAPCWFPTRQHATRHTCLDPGHTVEFSLHVFLRFVANRLRPSGGVCRRSRVTPARDPTSRAARPSGTASWATANMETTCRNRS